MLFNAYFLLLRTVLDESLDAMVSMIFLMQKLISLGIFIIISALLLHV